MRSYGIILLAALAAAAQEPPKPPLDAAAQTAPPKELDDALRARVSQFFQAHVDRKLRLADEVVAEESKDYFLEMEKPRYFGFEIAGISYSDEFTRAQVVVNCDGEVTMFPQGKVRVTMPLTTRWKLVDGKWFWFAEPTKARQTPFGLMQPGQSGQSATGMPFGQSATQGSAPNVPVPPMPSGNVTADKTAIELNAAKASSDSITVSNATSGWVTVEVFPPDVPGLSAKVEKKDIPPGGSGRVAFEYQPGGSSAPADTKATLQVLPLGPVFQVKVVFKAGAAQPQAAGTPAPEPAKTAKPVKASRSTKPGR